MWLYLANVRYESRADQLSTVPTYAVLFGAGASHGSGQAIPKAPPLATDLYEALGRLFPTVWGALPQCFSDLLRRDFEAGMREIGEKNPHALPPLQRAMASFFFGFIPGRNNLYRDLARRIKRNPWPGVLISLNYERLLELSLIAEGVRPFSGSLPDSGSCVELCLPHGCCHIFCESVRGTAAGVAFSGPNVFTRGQVKVIAEPAEHTKRIREDAFPPVMSYFDPAKLTSSGVNFIEEQRARYDAIIRGAKLVAIVGVKVRPHDKHLWEALSATNADIVYCSGERAGQEFAKWALENRVNKVTDIFYSYFDECFDVLCTRLGL
jgi:hypothetical protein